MARPRQVDMGLVAQAHALAIEAQSLDDLRCAQAVLLPALLDATLRANGRCPGRRTRDGGQVPVATAHSGSAALATGAGLGRPSSGGDERRRGTQLSAAVGQALCRRRHARRIAATRSAGAEAGATRGSVGQYRLLARHGWRKVAPDTRHPQERSDCAGGVEKKLPQALAALLKPPEVGRRRIRLMFQDEARFGRMVRIRRAWAPMPTRQMVCNGYEREFVYVYGAVSPLQGQFDWMITRQMNTANMSAFLAQVSAKHRRDFIVMVVDERQLARLQGPDRAQKRPVAAVAAVCGRAESAGARMGRTAGEGVSQPCIRRPSKRARSTRGALPGLGIGPQGIAQTYAAWPWIVRLNLNAQ